MHIKVPNTVERPKLVSVKNKKGDLKNKAQQRDLQYHQGRNGRDLAKYNLHSRRIGLPSELSLRQRANKYFT